MKEDMVPEPVWWASKCDVGQGLIEGFPWDAWPNLKVQIVFQETQRGQELSVHFIYKPEGHDSWEQWHLFFVFVWGGVTFWITILYQICLLQIFSPSPWFIVFILLTVYLTEQKFLILMKSNLSVCYYMNCNSVSFFIVLVFCLSPWPLWGPPLDTLQPPPSDKRYTV